MTKPTLQECLDWLDAYEKSFDTLHAENGFPKPSARSYAMIRAQLEAGKQCAEALANEEKAHRMMAYTSAGSEELRGQMMMHANKAGELQRILTQATATGLLTDGEKG